MLKRYICTQCDATVTSGYDLPTGFLCHLCQRHRELHAAIREHQEIHAALFGERLARDQAKRNRLPEGYEEVE